MRLSEYLLLHRELKKCCIGSIDSAQMNQNTKLVQETK